MSDLSPEMLALAAERYRKLALEAAFDPNNLASRPTDAQQEVFEQFGQVSQQWIVASNQCKPKYSLVLMADGTYCPISKIRPGDMVMAFDYKLEQCVPSRVTKLWKNGEKDVYRYYFKAHEWTDSTPNHLMPYHSGKKFGKRPIETSRELMITPAIIPGEYSGIPEYIALLGYLIGDGCLTRLHSKGVQFSNTNKEIIEAVRMLADKIGFKLRDAKNGDYFITPIEKAGKGKNSLINWLVKIGLDGAYAHDKFIPEVVFKASAEERCEFLAGLIATDGHITKRAVGYTSVSERLVRDIQRLLRTLGINSTLSKNTRKKDTHRDCWHVEIKSAKYIMQFHKLVTVPGKPAKKLEFSPRKYEDRLWSTSQVRKVEYLGKMPVYDITIEHHDHVYICDGLATSNSGKSQSCSRLTAWVLAENHPYWQRPEHWNKEPLLMVVCGRTGKQLEESIAPRICAYLPKDDYKVVKIGNITQRIEHKNGNRIVFQSLENPQVARERVQSYVAHFVWVDEMPSTVSIINELLMRLQSKQGYFVASFTPLVYNQDIRKMVDEVPEDIGRKYKFKMFDNPLYADPERQRQVLASYAHLTEMELNCRLYGDWMDAETSVWHIDREAMTGLPPGYSPSWRHVESSDPAVSSKFGLTVWAENPVDSSWWCIKDEYIEGIAAPDDIVKEVIRRTSGMNIMRRICDPHESWYLGQATKAGLIYICPKKDGRKHDMIKALQHSLSSGRLKIAHWCSRLIEELEGAQWKQSDTGTPKIQGANRYHLADTACYFNDLIPSPNKEYVPQDWQQAIRHHTEKVRERKQLAQKAKVGRKRKWILR
jgi:phage terminase large subunit-like protein